MKQILFIMTVLLSSVAFGQKVPTLPIFINKCIYQSADKEIYSKRKKNSAHFYALAFSFDATGKIDTLYYNSTLDAETKVLFGLESALLKKIKAYDFKFKAYASKIVLIPFYSYNVPDEVLDYKYGFLMRMENLIPEAVNGKSLIVLQPNIIANLPWIP